MIEFIQALNSLSWPAAFVLVGGMLALALMSR